MAAAGGDRLLPSHQVKTQVIQEGAESFSLLDENVASLAGWDLSCAQSWVLATAKYSSAPLLGTAQTSSFFFFAHGVQLCIRLPGLLSCF